MMNLSEDPPETAGRAQSRGSDAHDRGRAQPAPPHDPDGPLRNRPATPGPTPCPPASSSSRAPRRARASTATPEAARVTPGRSRDTSGGWPDRCLIGSRSSSTCRRPSTPRVRPRPPRLPSCALACAPPASAATSNALTRPTAIHQPQRPTPAAAYRVSPPPPMRRLTAPTAAAR